MESNRTTGHLLALISTLFWGTTFISTKVLLTGFQPVEILFFRFLISLALLAIIYPHRLKGTTLRQELTFAAAGLSGISLYYLMENVALTYTLASNVGIIVSIAPCLTALITHLVLRQEGRLRPGFFAGFLLAMAGICLISFNGASLQLNPMGDLLAALAALLWAIYTVLVRVIGGYGYHPVQITRRVFAYGMLFMLPMLALFDFRLELERFANPLYLSNILFLGVGASALCFVIWNVAVSILGAVKTSIYIYMVPVVTVITSVLILREPITWMAALGILFTLSGLALSERHPGGKKELARPHSTQ